MQKVSSESQGPSSQYEVHRTRVSAGARRSLIMQFQENVELPVLAIRENAHPVSRTPSTSSFLVNTPRHYAVRASDCSLNFKLLDKWSQALRRTTSLLSAVLIFVSTGTEN